MARVLKGFNSFTCTPHTFIRNRNESYLPLPSKPQRNLVSVYRVRAYEIPKLWGRWGPAPWDGGVDDP